MGIKFTVISDRIRFFINRARERLWVKPLVYCMLSIVGALIAKIADVPQLQHVAPLIKMESVETLLSIMASSMLVIATFAVGSMVSAYASVGNTASPRSFTLVVADDVSQHALSTFIGAFIFSIVGLVAVKNDYFQTGGYFVLFLLTALVFAIVILTFVRWVDRIARLGRLETTIEKVEEATADAMKQQKLNPALGGVPVESVKPSGQAIFSDRTGYLQHIDISVLQSCAENINGRLRVAVLPGTFVTPQRALAYVVPDSIAVSDSDYKMAVSAFLIGKTRVFDNDPRYGLVVLSQIAARALSPGVNDPGTAIDILGIMTRLFVTWSERDKNETDSEDNCECDRVEVPRLSVKDMFDDAFTAIARDGSDTIEVLFRLQKTLATLAAIGDEAMQQAAKHHARRGLSYAQKDLKLPEELAVIQELSRFAFDRTALDKRH